MDLDVIVLGAGAAGEAAGSLGGELGAKVAVVERDLVGGQCAYWACMPTKALLDGARRRALGAPYTWDRASMRRDWMISREVIEYPDDSAAVSRLEGAGARLVRGEARIIGRGKVEVRSPGSLPVILEGRNLIVCTGSEAVIPSIDGLAEAGFWTDHEATTTRELPSSVVILGAGPMGVEVSQIFARFGVGVILVGKDDRILPRDHAMSSKAIHDQLVDDGVDVRLGLTADAVRIGGRGRIVGLSDGTTVEAAEVVVALGRRQRDMRALGVEEAGAKLNGSPVEPDDSMKLAEGLYLAGDAAGGLQFTHIADYEGRIAVRSALGQEVRADLRSVPKATYTDPESGGVGLTVDEARDQGIDAFEVSSDFATTARGYTIEGSRGHVTLVVDRDRRTLAGAFAACPGASELIHEAVLAIKQDIPLEVLADTIHAFPTGSRVFGNVAADALKELA